MPRLPKLYLEDILSAIEKVERYTKDSNFHSFIKDEMRYDAVLKNLEVIGEAVKNLPAEIKKKHPAIEWKKIAGLRDILSHEYFGIEQSIIWDVIQNKLEELKEEVTKMIRIL